MTKVEVVVLFKVSTSFKDCKSSSFIINEEEAYVMANILKANGYVVYVNGIGDK